MRSTLKQLLVAGLAMATVAGSLVPAQAMTIAAPKVAINTSTPNVVDVQYYGDRDDWRRGPPRGYYRDHDRGWGGDRYYRSDRDRRRERNNVLIPLGAFAAGAIIGGALNQQPRETYRPVPEYRQNPEFAPRPAPVYRGRNAQAHVNWCAGRYRSYDYRSNTFQPYNGPRQTCYSPYS